MLLLLLDPTHDDVATETGARDWDKEVILAHAKNSSVEVRGDFMRLSTYTPWHIMPSGRVAVVVWLVLACRMLLSQQARGRVQQN